jgi:hypothetical protein
MYRILPIIFLCIISVSYGQKTQDSLFCFEKSEILILANKIQLMKDSLRYRKDIIYQQDTLLSYYDKQALLCKFQIENRQNTIITLEKENLILKNVVTDLKPKWYDNKWFWFSNGVIVTIATILLIR